jgi:VanZ family protein
MSAVTPSSISNSTIPSRAWRVAAWLAVFAWAGIIYWLSSKSGREIDRLNIFHLWDKAAHFLAFAAGAPALYCASRWSFGGSAGKAILITIGLLALYGAADEFHQLLAPHRSGADLYDWTADTLGSITGAFLTAFFYARTQTHPRAACPAPAGD